MNWLVIWFFLLIFVTTMNKTLFSALKCPYPISITLIHMVSSAVYSGVLRYCMPSYYNAREIKKDERIRLVLVSVLFIVNIVLGNVSIKYCSLALDQIVRCTMPAWTAVVQYLLLGEKLSGRVYLTLVPIIGGAMMVCKGEIKATPFGVVVLLVSCFVSTIKGIVTKLLLSSGNKLSPLQLLTINSSLGAFELVPITLYAETPFFTSFIGHQPIYVYLLLLFHGFTAFALNVSNFEATKSTTPLVINITGNVKQVCMIIISVLVFKQPLLGSSIIGCLLTIGGSFWYSVERYKFDKEKKEQEQSKVEEVSDEKPLINKEEPTRV